MLAILKISCILALSLNVLSLPQAGGRQGRQPLGMGNWRDTFRGRNPELPPPQFIEVGNYLIDRDGYRYDRRTLEPRGRVHMRQAVWDQRFQEQQQQQRQRQQQRQQQPQNNAAASGQQGQSSRAAAQGRGSNSRPYEITYSQEPWAPPAPANGQPVRSTKVGKGKKQYTVYEDGAIFDSKGNFYDQVPLTMGQFQKISDIANGEDSVAWLEDLDRKKGIARGVPVDTVRGKPVKSTVKPAPGYPTTPVTQPTSGGSSSNNGASSSGASSSGTSSASGTSRNPTPYDPAKDKGKGPMYKGAGPNQHDELRKSRRIHGAQPAQPSKAPKAPSPPAPRSIQQSAKQSITAPKIKMDPKKRVV
ncbi:hypothetical protein MP228_006333 [Amoeboaphelidium protococcarum]|nr:hypothetical protein MP228_006333 [Amoeboaphelidium protococcarum]